MKTAVTNNFKTMLQDAFTPYYDSAPCPLTGNDIYTAAFTDEERRSLDVLLECNKGIIDHVSMARFQLEGMPSDAFHTPIEFDFEDPMPMPRIWWSGSQRAPCIPASHSCYTGAVEWLTKVVKINQEIFLIRNQAFELAGKCSNMMQLVKVWPELGPFIRKIDPNAPGVWSELGTQLRYLREASSANILNSRPPRLAMEEARLIVAARPVLAKIHLLSHAKATGRRSGMKVRVGRF